MSDIEELSVEDDISEELEKHEYRNWVKGAKALEVLQEGLAPFVDKETADKHKVFKNKLPNLPSSEAPCGCTIDNILPNHDVKQCKLGSCLCKKKPKKRRKCPKQYCSTFCQLILLEHNFDSPEWSNTDISTWSSDHWNVAKCFLKKTSSPEPSARKTDAAGLLTIIINAKFIPKQETSVFQKARDKRNEVLHKGKQELTKDELKDAFVKFVAVLKDPKALLNDPDAIKAVKRLEKLEIGQIYISMQEEERALQKRVEELQHELDESKDEAVSHMNENEELKEQLRITQETIRTLKERLMNTTTGKSTKDDTDSDSSDDEDSEDDGDELETKLKTDEAKLEDVYDDDILLRDYQNELAVEGLKGRNVIIMAPTNTGKTRVACKIVQEHFRKKRQSRVIFLVENEALALQQGKVFEKLLPAYRTKVVSGGIQRDKKQFLKDILDMRDIFVVTAQVLLNALQRNEIENVAKFSMMIFDECHHTDQQHRFNEIMGFYLKLKLDVNFPREQLPQIIGLTASLGTGGSTSTQFGIAHMKNIMSNLDACCLCTVKEHKEQLANFANKAKEHIKVAEKRTNTTFKKAVFDIREKIDTYISTHQSISKIPSEDSFIVSECRVPVTIGSEQFQNWLSCLKDGIAKLKSEAARKVLFPCRRHLDVYDKALMIYADARVKDAMKILLDFMKKEADDFQRKQNAYENPEDEDLLTEKFLLDLCVGIKSITDDEEEVNPKLQMLQDIVLRHLGRNETTRGIIFVKTRNLAVSLENWMNETEELKGFNAKACIGQGSAEQKGLTKHIQRTVLKYFRKGRHRVIIATSVIEEGLDITSCNLVVRYEYVTNEIGRLQSRGRARARNSRYYVITEEDSWIVAKEEKNALLEDLMNKIIPEVQRAIERDPVSWEKELQGRQMARKEREEREEKERRAKISKDVRELQCFNCSTYICLSSDVRKIQPSHHVVIDPNVKKKLIIVRKPNPRFKNDDLKFDGDTLCANPKCNFKLGGVCDYLGLEFPLLAIKSFRVVDNDRRGRTFKKWKDVNFDVTEIPVEDLGTLYRRSQEDSDEP